MEQPAIGIDIGATYTKFGIMRRSGELVASERIHTEGEFHAYLDELAKKNKRYDKRNRRGCNIRRNRLPQR